MMVLIMNFTTECDEMKTQLPHAWPLISRNVTNENSETPSTSKRRCRACENVTVPGEQRRATVR